MTTRQKPAARFEAHWLAHTLRLRDLESHQASKQTPVFPAISDSHDGDDAQRWLIQRAYERNKDSESLQWIRRWVHSARFSLLLIAVLAVVSGASAAIGFFGAEQRSVNVIWTLIGLIGVHGLALLMWLFGGRMTGGWLGRASFWLMGHWPKTAPSNSNTRAALSSALASVMSANGLGKWALSCITHSAWLVALLATLLTILLALSVRSYSFVLETTILSESVFVQLVRGFSYLPSLLGFAAPSDEMIAAALDATGSGQSDSVRRAWASCLSGGLVVYAVIPRVLVLIWSLLSLRHAYSTLRLDVRLPGFAELFAPSVDSKQIVDAAPKVLRTMQLEKSVTMTGDSLALVGLELGPDLSWPPARTRDLKNLLLFDEVVATGVQQHAVLQVLRASPVRRILVMCDARLSPDRGSLQWLIDVSAYAGNMALCVLSPDLKEAETRQQIWAQSLAAIGLDSKCLFYSQADGLKWLQSNE